MLKNILKLEGVQQLSNDEQKEIKGGINYNFDNSGSCHSGSYKAPYCCLKGIHSLCGWG